MPTSSANKRKWGRKRAYKSAKLGSSGNGKFQLFCRLACSWARQASRPVSERAADKLAPSSISQVYALNWPYRESLNLTEASERELTEALAS